jgi:predicted transcriptional regulator
MSKVTIGIASRARAKARMSAAFKGKAQSAFICFDNVGLLWRVLTPKRWDLVRAVAGAGPQGIRAIARKVGRDVKSVHGDVTALTKAGVLDRAADGKVEFPYDEIHVDFTLRAA